MKFYKFWALATEPLTVDGEARHVKCYGGSDESIEHAVCAANKRVQQIQHKINTNQSSWQDDYEVTIREEIVHTLSDSAVITRNRYGALILNTTDVAILDIDGHLQRGLFEKIFGAPEEPLALLRWRLNKLKRKGPLQALSGWRLYQTHNGWRLMLNKESLDLHHRSFLQIIRALRADWLYGMLCQKQQCYRARLTPKPYRMRIPTIRYRCPMPPEESEHARQWTQMYAEKSRSFSVCHLLHAEGADLSDLPAVREHDRYCCRLENLKLA